jgi:pseudouridine kinase
MSSKIAVIGAVNVDLVAKSNETPKLEDSNVGTLSISTGGVGYNIATNLSQLGHEVYFFTIIGQDPFLNVILNDCETNRINMDYIKESQSPNNTYTAVLDHQQDLMIAVNHMELIDHLTPYHLNHHLPILNEMDMVIVEANVSKDVIEWVGHHIKVPKVFESVSVKKVEKIIGNDDLYDVIKFNNMEYQSVKDYLMNGLTTQYLITNKDQPVIIVQAQVEEMYSVEPIDSIVSTLGAGDAFLSGFIDGMLSSDNTKICVEKGHAQSMKVMQVVGATVRKEDKHD